MPEGSPIRQTAPASPSTLTFVVRDAEGKMQVWEGGALRPFESPQPPLAKGGAEAAIPFQKGQRGGLSVRPAAPTFPLKTAAFYFSPSDAAEALAAGQAQKFLPAPAKQFSLQKIIAKLLPSLPQLNQEQQRRLGQVALTYLRGVRGLVDAKEILERPVEQGGVGLPNDPRSANDPAQVVLLSLRSVREQISAEGGIVVDALQSVISPPQPLLKEEGAHTPQIGTQLPPVPLLRKEGEHSPQTVRGTSEEGKQIPPPPLREGGHQSSPVTTVTSPERLAAPSVPSAQELPRRAAVEPGKLSTADVRRVPPKLVGPLEELAGVTVEVFRRLGATPQQAAKRLAEKIELLGQESVTQRSLGLQAWRRSSVYQLYLQLGRLALEAGLPVDRIIEERLRRHEPVLTLAEFQAIAELNGRLRV